MPAATAGPDLATLPFVDPQRTTGWTHRRVRPRDGRPLAARPLVLGAEVAGAGRSRGLAEWVAETWSTSLLVVARDHVVHEWYAEGLGPTTLFLGASMTKSVLAHLVGRAVARGELSLGTAVAASVPELAGSGYARTTVRDLLTMTSGVDWVEDHRDPTSPAARLLGCFAAGGDSRALLREVGPGVDPGRRYTYCTADSQVLDWVRERTTGRSFVDDLADLWRELGCVQEAVVAVDGAGVALAGGGLAATTRDWARVALLAVSGRNDLGERLLAPAWVDQAARPAYPFLGVGRLPSTLTSHVGFGLHWWPLDDRGDRVAADGSRGQLAAVDRQTGAVVVKTSLWPYADPWVDRQARDLSYLGLHTLLDLASTDPAAPATGGPRDPAPTRPRRDAEGDPR